MKLQRDLKGFQFGRLTVISSPIRDRIKRTTYFDCRCVCTKVVRVTRSGLLIGDTRSCGCLKLGQDRERLTTHGMSDSPEYRAWSMMKARCLKDRSPRHHYKERGITVCRRWLNSFENFYRDMGKRPAIGYSLERKDNNRGYSPRNCKWATQKEQTNNRVNNKFVEHGKLKLTLKQWADKLGANVDCFYGRWRRGLRGVAVIQDYLV